MRNPAPAPWREKVEAKKFSEMHFVIYESDSLQAEKLRLTLLADCGANDSCVSTIRDWSTIEALSKASPIDVIFLAQDLDGVSLLDIVVRAGALAPTTTVIVMSDSDDDPATLQALQSGAQDVLVRGALGGKALKRMIANAVERRRLRDSLEQLNVQLHEISEQRNRFLGMAAHDLRGPIGNIWSITQLLLGEINNKISKEDHALVELVATASQSMLRLVDELLDVSKIEAGVITLTRSNVDLGKLVEKCVGLHQRLAHKKGIQIQCNLDPNVNLSVDGDKMSQVIDNLLSNAIKYSVVGKPVQVRLTGSSQFVDVAVEDQGQGIPESALTKLFKPFQTAGSIPTGGEKSTGLGLAIVKKIVSEHGGEVGVKSKKNVGSIFWFRLPR